MTTLTHRLVLRALCLLPFCAAPAAATVIDAFEELAHWRAYSSQGADVEIAQDEGQSGMGMRIDFDFHGSGGFVIVRRDLPAGLPDNYRFSFAVRGDAKPNDLEFKLIDRAGKKVWWKRHEGFSFPQHWQRVTVKKRHFSQAWGPGSGGTPKDIGAVEIAIASDQGGKGSVWIDELEFVARAIHVADVKTSWLTASTTDELSSLENLQDDDSLTGWRSGSIAEEQWLLINFGRPTEFGGLIIDWDDTDFARAYDIEISEDGEHWHKTYSVEDNRGGRNYVYLPDSESHFMRLQLRRSSQSKGYRIRSLSVEPYRFSATPNAFYASIAKESRPGTYPRYFSGEQSYWTVAGAAGGAHEALINEDGMVEIKEGAYSLEPFLHYDGEFVTWRDVERTHELVGGYVPIPVVGWEHHGLGLELTALAAGNAQRSRLLLRYRIRNDSSSAKNGGLFLALRPFQVNPPWQSLNVKGGVGQIRDVTAAGDRITVDGAVAVRSLTPVSHAGAAKFEQGDISHYLSRDRVPAQAAVVDPMGRASAALQYRFDLAPGAAETVYVVAPLDGQWQAPEPEHIGPGAEAYWEAQFAATREFWTNLLNSVEISVPDEDPRLFDTLRATLAFIMINQDGAALQPGSRDYARSWIRDGAVTSSALLALGHTAPVRSFIEWYAKHQLADGKIPCCVDQRGADSVPENDSHGQWIYLVMQYYRYTRDIGFLARLWPSVEAAVGYMETQRSTRLTESYREGEARLFFGLMPDSISHEGYSARPVHSYWDDFFALRGYKDAAEIASILDYPQTATDFGRARDAFRGDLYRSIAASMKHHDVAYIPGAAELGDFDATSTAIAVDPVGELARLPQVALEYTFEAYYDFFTRRRAATDSWEAYTPYELRIVSTLIRMGYKDRAHELMEFFYQGQRPPGWRQWAEVVWREPGAGKFIGDMPHTWVGAEFIRAVRNMFVFERESDQALVLAAGVLEAWVRGAGGVQVRRLPTQFGSLNFKLWLDEDHQLQADLTGDLALPPGKIVLHSPLTAPIVGVVVDDEEYGDFDAGEVRLNRFPARLTIRTATGSLSGNEVAASGDSR